MVVAALPVPDLAGGPISRRTRSATLTGQRGCSALGLLPPGPRPFRRLGHVVRPFGRILACNHPPRRDFISVRQAGIACQEICPAVADLRV